MSLKLRDKVHAENVQVLARYGVVITKPDLTMRMLALGLGIGLGVLAAGLIRLGVWPW